MDKHSKKSSSLLHYPVLVVFSLFFIGLFALDLITPDRAYSEMENTTLSQRPALTQLSAKGLNSYFTAYTKYVKDQVFGRDEWISLQSVVETTLLQKEQNGGILLGKEHMMFPRTFSLLDSENRTLPKNTAAVEALCQRHPGKVDVLLAPAASVIYPEKRACKRAVAGRGCLSRPAFRCRTGRRRTLCGCAADPCRTQGRIYLLPHRPSLDEPWRILRLPAAVRCAGPDPLRPRRAHGSDRRKFLRHPLPPRPAHGMPCRILSPTTTCRTA